jgi:hypothetical protein
MPDPTPPPEPDPPADQPDPHDEPAVHTDQDRARVPLKTYRDE